MIEVFKTAKSIKDEDNNDYVEKIYIFDYESEDEADDFQLLNHNEQISACGLKKENSTPDKDTGTVNRYFIDCSDCFVVVKEVVMSW